MSYYKDDTIWGVDICEECKDEVYRIKEQLKQYRSELDNNTRQLAKYLSVYELLKAIDLYNGGAGEVQVKKVEQYVESINTNIISSLEFIQVKDMNDLRDTIVKDKLYRELLFNVREIKSTKANEYRRVTKEKFTY